MDNVEAVEVMRWERLRGGSCGKKEGKVGWDAHT